MERCPCCGQVVPEPRRLRGFEVAKGADIRTLLPVRKTKYSAGYDMYLPCDVTIEPYQDSGKIWLGVKAYMQANEYLQLHIRSSYGNTLGLRLANCVGIIDADYYGNSSNDGDIGIVLRNRTGKTVELHAGDCVCQGIFCQYLLADNDHADAQRDGGMGSTGR